MAHGAVFTVRAPVTTPPPRRGRGDQICLLSLCGCLEPRGLLLYMVYIDLCRCEGYGFQAVYSG